MSDMMDVVEIDQFGGPDVMVMQARAVPQPGPGEARIRVTAAGVNFIDTYHRTGLYPVKLPFVPGSEVAGIVEAVGDGVTGLAPGERVACLTAGGGGYASHYVGAAAQMMKLPDSISDTDAAAVLLKGLTAWMLLFEVRRAMPGDSALVWAPSGGVGVLLVPWAASLGVKVIAVTSGEEKAQLALDNGADAVIVRGDGVDVGAQARALTGGRGVDVSYDSVGRTSQTASLDALGHRGWYVSYGNASGMADPLPLGRLAGKALVAVRPALFSFVSDPGALARAAQALFGALRVGTLKAHVGRTAQLAEAADVHRALEAGETVGATVLVP